MPNWLQVTLPLSVPTATTRPFSPVPLTVLPLMLPRNDAPMEKAEPPLVVIIVLPDTVPPAPLLALIAVPVLLVNVLPLTVAEPALMASPVPFCWKVVWVTATFVVAPLIASPVTLYTIRLLLSVGAVVSVPTSTAA